MPASSETRSVEMGWLQSTSSLRHRRALTPLAGCSVTRSVSGTLTLKVPAFAVGHRTEPAQLHAGLGTQTWLVQVASAYAVPNRRQSALLVHCWRSGSTARLHPASSATMVASIGADAHSGRVETHARPTMSPCGPSLPNAFLKCKVSR